MVELKKDIEIGRETAAAMPEEQAIGRVGDVTMDGFRIEVVGEVETADRQRTAYFGFTWKSLERAHPRRKNAESGEVFGTPT